MPLGQSPATTHGLVANQVAQRQQTGVAVQPHSQAHSRPGVEAFRVSLSPKTGGQALPAEVQAKMEAALGADFSDVRVHVGREASSVGAIAFTWGSNIHFAPGQYSPNTTHGQKLIGHELAHVVQQRAGRVRNPFGSGVAVVQDHALEAEAERLGTKAAMTPVARGEGGTLQRKATPQSTIQRVTVQPSAAQLDGAQVFRATGSGPAGPIGSVKLWKRGNGVAEITHLSVQPDHRRHGLGKELMNPAIQSARRTKSGR